MALFWFIVAAVLAALWFVTLMGASAITDENARLKAALRLALPPVDEFGTGSPTQRAGGGEVPRAARPRGPRWGCAMRREWKPGDVPVAVISWQSPTGRHGGTMRALRVATGYHGSAWMTETFGLVNDRDVTKVRPLVVIDPEDHEQVERLLRAYWQQQAALREFADPKHEVFRHHIASRNDGIVTADCGKAWRPDERAKVMGDCPECSEIVKAGWSA